MPKRIFATLEDLEQKIEEYFASLERGDPEVAQVIPTLGKMYEYLGISKMTASNYCREGHEFKEAMEFAKERVEAQIEHAIVNPPDTRSLAGRIFALKNRFGWADKKDVEVHGTGPGGAIPLIAVPMESKSIEEWQERVRIEAHGGAHPELDGPRDDGLPKVSSRRPTEKVRAVLTDDVRTGARSDRPQRGKSSRVRRKSATPDPGDAGNSE